MSILLVSQLENKDCMYSMYVCMYYVCTYVCMVLIKKGMFCNCGMNVLNAYYTKYIELQVVLQKSTNLCTNLTAHCA